MTPPSHIIDELYDIDPSLREHDAQVRAVVEQMLLADPAHAPTSAFLSQLRMHLRQHATTLQASTPQHSPFAQLHRFFTYGGGLVVAGLLLPILYVTVLRPQQGLAPVAPVAVEESAQDSPTNAARRDAEAPARKQAVAPPVRAQPDARKEDAAAASPTPIPVRDEVATTETLAADDAATRLQNPVPATGNADDAAPEATALFATEPGAAPAPSALRAADDRVYRNDTYQISFRFPAAAVMQEGASADTLARWEITLRESNAPQATPSVVIRIYEASRLGPLFDAWEGDGILKNGSLLVRITAGPDGEATMRTVQSTLRFGPR